jgi:hypothetical protein
MRAHKPHVTVMLLLLVAVFVAACGGQRPVVGHRLLDGPERLLAKAGTPVPSQRDKRTATLTPTRRFPARQRGTRRTMAQLLGGEPRPPGDQQHGTRRRAARRPGERCVSGSRGRSLPRGRR